MTTNVSNKKIANAVPGPKGYPLVGVLPDILKNPLDFLTDTMLEHGDIAKLNLGFGSVYLVNHPRYVEHILRTNWRNYEKGEMWQPIRTLIGGGLPVVEGDEWIERRRLIQPAFHRNRIAKLTEIMAENIEKNLQRWEEYADTGETFDVLDEMMHTGLDVIVGTMFSTSITDEESKILTEKFSLIAKLVMYRMWTFFLPTSFPRPGDRQFNEGVKVADEILYRLIERRRANGEDTGDLLSLLMATVDEETGEAMTDVELRDELMTVLTAGHETAAIALSWVFYLLTQHPDVEQKMRDELQSTLGGRTPSFEDLPNLKYTKMVIQESMRLYPPVWPIPRVAVKEDHIGDYRIPSGSMVVISPFVVHRNPDFWKSPNLFLPDRFDPDKMEQEDRYAYIPFGGGPRICIGNQFAMVQSQLALAVIAQRYRLKLQEGFKVVPHSSSTTKPKHGIKVTAYRVN